MIQEAIRSDQSLMYFVLFRKEKNSEQVKEACFEYAGNQKVFLGRQKEITEDETGKFKVEVESLQELDKKTSKNMDLLRQKFEDLALLVSKQKPDGVVKAVLRQDIVCCKCKKTGHYASQCQLSTETISNCTYCSKYGDKINACYKKHPDEARQKAEDKTTQQIQILREEEGIEGQEQKPLMYVNKAEHKEILEDAVLMKRWASGEPEQKQVRF